MHLDEYWRKKELDFKRALILQITNTDALSDSQREEIADMIQNYDVNNFKEQADSVFVRKRFLKGNLLGIRINDDEKLDIKRLARSYNDRIKRIVNDMSQSMNEDCFSQFKIWEEKLLAKINANLTELNPELKSLAEIIRIETENITELENNQTMIQASLDTIKDLMSSATGMNAELNHITVLEEAHNLLRRTSNEQSAEGSNLLGKSVEMLSNAIAEMRTYGEGFIIADQAPGLMDMSVIRNTNTKIILRLPDQADRELVGRAANLNEDQITELAKVPCGVAAVYQNEWIQPVLCKVDLFAAPEKPFMFDPDDNDLDNYCKTEVEESLLNCIMEKEILRRGNKTDLKALKSKIIKSKLETCVKRDFMEYLEHDGENAIETLRKLIYDFLSAENAIIEAKQCNDIVEWTRTVVDRLNPSLRAYPNKQIDLALALILYEQTLRDASYGSVFCKFTEVYKNEGGVF